MGFRFKRFDYVGGVAPWNGSEYNRGAATLTDFADFIISCGKGWSLDTSRNATTTSYIDVPMVDISGNSTSFVSPSLFFVNANGAKLFLNCCGGSTYCAISVGKDHLMLDVPYSVTHPNYTGIVMSMIPAGSSNTFGLSFDNSFLPSDATYIFGSALFASTGDGTQQNFMCHNTSGKNYSYGLFVDSCCIGIGGGCDSSITPTIKPGYFIGRVIGTLAHEESTNQAQYGIIKFYDSCNEVASDVEFKNATRSTYASLTNFGANFSQAINQSTSYSNIYGACCGSYFKANGNRIDGRNGANVRFYPHASILAENSKLSSQALSGANRWVPFEAGVISNDLSTNGIVTGDGMKGYLDTDLFRCAQCNLNQLYANGAFIGADETYHLMLGWDATNTDSL